MNENPTKHFLILAVLPVLATSSLLALSSAESGLANLLFCANGLLILVAFWRGFRTRRLYSSLWGALGAFHVVGYLDFLLSGYEVITSLITGQAIIFLGNILLFSAIEFFDRGPLRLSPQLANYTLPTYYGFRTDDSEKYLRIMLLFAALSLLIQFKDGLAVFNSNWSDLRGGSGTQYLRSLSNFLAFLFFPAIWVAVRTKATAYIAALAIATFAFVMLSGSRAIFATIPAAIFIDVLTANIKIRSKAILLLKLALSAYSVHVFLRIIRGLGLGGLIAIVSSGDLGTRINDHQDIIGLGGEEGAYRTLYFIVENDFQGYPYNSFVTPARLALIYVPARIAPFKPRDITTDMWFDGLRFGFFDGSHDYERRVEVGDSGIGGSIHPHLWGDAFANGKFFGVFVYAILLALFAVKAERYAVRFTQAALFSIGPCIAVCYIFIARGSIVAGFGFVAYTVPLLFIISLPLKVPLLRKVRRSNIPKARGPARRRSVRTSVRRIDGDEKS